MDDWHVFVDICIFAYGIVILIINFRLSRIEAKPERLTPSPQPDPEAR